MTHEPANQPDDQDRRVLIVDDDEEFAAGLVDILQSHGCSVAVAHSAEQARSVIQDFDAGVALVDIRLGSDKGQSPADTIDAWIAAGAPDRRRWGQMNSRRDRGARP